MVINTNISAQTGARLLSESTQMLSKSLERLSTGSKITSPDDDAAGLAVSMKFDAESNRIAAARNNIGNAISFSQTQDGFLQKVDSVLNRMSELATLAQDVTKNSNDLALYNEEFESLASYVSDVTTKDFNGVSLFSSSTLGVTIDSDANTFSMAGVDLSTDVYNQLSGLSVSSSSNAATALGSIQTAIENLASDRSTVGTNISRLNFTSEHLSIQKDNLDAANSRIKDVDVAEESTQFARANILVQAGTSMLAQANAIPQSALQLLG